MDGDVSPITDPMYAITRRQVRAFNRHVLDAYQVLVIAGSAFCSSCKFTHEHDMHLCLRPSFDVRDYHDDEASS